MLRTTFWRLGTAWLNLSPNKPHRWRKIYEQKNLKTKVFRSEEMTRSAARNKLLRRRGNETTENLSEWKNESQPIRLSTRLRSKAWVQEWNISNLSFAWLKRRLNKPWTTFQNTNFCLRVARVSFRSRNAIWSVSSLNLPASKLMPKLTSVRSYSRLPQIPILACLQKRWWALSSTMSPNWTLPGRNGKIWLSGAKSLLKISRG